MGRSSCQPLQILSAWAFMKRTLKLIQLLRLNYQYSLLYNQVLWLSYYQNLKILIIFCSQVSPWVTCNSEAARHWHFTLWHKHLHIKLRCEERFYGYISVSIILWECQHLLWERNYVDWDYSCLLYQNRWLWFSLLPSEPAYWRHVSRHLQLRILWQMNSLIFWTFTRQKTLLFLLAVTILFICTLNPPRSYCYCWWASFYFCSLRHPFISSNTSIKEIHKLHQPRSYFLLCLRSLNSFI